MRYSSKNIFFITSLLLAALPARTTIVTLLLFSGIELSYAQSSFVKVSLAQGVSVELPAHWQTMSANKKATLQAWQESVNEKYKLKDVEHDLALVANNYDDDGFVVASFAIRYYPTMDITNSEAIAGGASFIRELDEVVKQNFKAGLEAAGGKLIAWQGTSRKIINGTSYFVSRNRTISPRGEKFHGVLVRYLNAGKSFTIIMSYRDDQAFYLEPVCEKIIHSIKLIPIKDN